MENTMFWTVYIGAIIFLFGLIMGSFFNVCIYRVPMNLSIISPPSHCGSCNHKLAPLDLIPVFSWIMLGRKCRYCKALISWRYPLVEFLTAVLFVLAFMKFQLSLDLPFYLALISILIIITFIDIDHRIIPDRFIIIGLILDIFFLASHRFTNWQNALIGGLIGGGSILLIDLSSRIIFKKEGMGFGDVKLMLMTGIFLGITQTVVALLAAVWIGAIAGVIILKTRKDKDDHYMPFGPFLAAGCILAIFIGESLAKWYIGML
ncbi:MAG: prepilin peptidase [Saccharofermentanales bacterium]